MVACVPVVEKKEDVRDDYYPDEPKIISEYS